MLRKTLISIAVSGALYVSSSYALELGELTSQSNLDEPYRGKIEISDVGTLTTDDILIRLGSESEFRQAGLAPTRVLSQLRFNVTNENGELVVAVSSNEPLVADELHFILAARWPSGQVVREYQAPLNQSALVEKSQKEVVQSAPVSSSASTLPDSTGSVFSQATSSAEAMPVNGQANVVKGNTLWSIAGQNRPTNQLTIYQTMMAIQALNKEAFYSDNINLLKEGAVLRLPTQDQIALFNKTTSEEEFKRQHDAWMALKASKGQSSVEKAQLNTQAKAKDAESTPSAGADKLTLSSGQSSLPENSASSNAGENSRAGLNDLQTELSASQELLDKEQREKAELSVQLGDLNKQLETLERLISLKDEQLADLQQQFVNAQQTLQEQKNTVDQLLEADQIRREKEQVEADSLVNKIFGNPIIVSMGAVVILLLGFLIGLVMRRSGKNQGDESLKKNEFDLSSSAAAATVASMNYAQDDQVKEELQEEDPFAFDFDTDDDPDDMEHYDSFDSGIASMDELDPVDDMDFSEDPETELESAVEDEIDLEEDFSSFDETDDLPEPEINLDSDDELEGFVEDDIPTMTPDVVDVENSEPELDVSSEAEREEESFVSSLLNDVDQEDVDESAIFNGMSNDSIASTIEETLAEAQENESEFEVPAFGEAEAAADEEESDEEEEFDFFDGSGDEVATKLDLARAYMDMGDEEGARVILEDVVESGNEKQISEAQNMIERMFPSD
ncbi:Tfp pilus assembly protein FimV-like protein [Marinomonas ushuaiensis DSM 15871]|uniref:Tfp pilus assembly protein FimV-like protein n=1 Tax=Marinomonas ushuaiensis DSM 15871 TaxID=1122207 RepID=X7E8R6_9GAMM|nr:FimV/HubP family polar landmark protein [Marinomonas ushuaiensis]ETX11591.1 Tfp pilus assembly protein FimV-like protein [Marinomonas ushuaiensis DSM 15871]